MIGRTEVDTLRGRTAWMPLAGHALAPDVSPDLYRDLYAAAAPTCLIDWRVTNLIASRFWPAQGFVPTAYRLVRRVDPRIASDRRR